MDPELSVHVLCDCAWGEQGMLESDSDWVSFEAIVGALPVVVAAAGAAEVEGRAVDALGELPVWVQFPWLQEEWHRFDAEKGSASSKKASAKAADDLGGGPSDADDDDSDMSPDDIFEELAGLRARWAEREDRILLDFKVVLRGGAWTLGHRGVIADSFRGEAAGARPADFCHIYSLPRSGTFSIAKDSEHTAKKLAESFCDRLQFWFNMWVDRDCSPACVFTEADGVLYEQPQWLKDFAADADESTQARLFAALALTPKNP